MAIWISASAPDTTSRSFFLSWVIIGFVVFLTMLYIVISILFPEWVGMTGKKALQIQKEQEEETTSQSPQQDL
jgi:hypothetical protein